MTLSGARCHLDTIYGRRLLHRCILTSFSRSRPVRHRQYIYGTLPLHSFPLVYDPPPVLVPPSPRRHGIKQLIPPFASAHPDSMRFAMVVPAF